MTAARKKELAPAIEPMYLSREHAAAFVSLSESAWSAMVSRGDAPAPRQLSAGRAVAASLARLRRGFGHQASGHLLFPPVLDSFGCSQRIAG